MPRPDSKNIYIRESIKTWSLKTHTFSLIDGGKTGFLVRVFPHDDSESYWLDSGPWETESGAAWSILNSLDENE